MAFWDRVTSALAMGAGIETRSGWLEPAPSLETQLAAIRSGGYGDRPWRVASIREALGVPAIFGAVTLVSNLTGSMSMKSFRGQVEMEPDDRPRLIVRPDPFRIPREFYRGTAYNIASRGEAWWWVAKRDTNGLALSVMNIAPREVTVEEDPNDPRYPVIRWRDRVMRNEDMRQLVYSMEPGELRGSGPLQMCGAAISVAVESQEWAANFYASGGHARETIHSAVPMTADEAYELKSQWSGTPNNMPRVVDPGIDEIDYPDPNPQGAQMLDARQFNNAESATMFNIPAPILNAAISGSSVTYQNVGTEFEKLLRQCLRPNYLEVIEQTMSDLLPRSIVARFNTDSLTLADIKTRYEVYGLGIANQIITPEQAQSFEGIAAGDVENAAVPFAPPQAIPTIGSIQARSAAVRCDGMRVLRNRLVPCDKLLAESGPFSGRCPRCKKEHGVAA